jgi:hypothetical protein
VVLQAIIGRVLVWSWQKCSVRSSVLFALNLRYRVRARNARSCVTPNNQNSTYTSTRHTLTTMAPINNTLAAIKALKLEEKLIY